MNSVVEISSDGISISVSKGFLLVKQQESEEKIPLSEIETLVINSYGAYISNKAIMRLSEEGVPIVHSGQNAIPCAITLPYGNNVYRKDRIELQIKSSLPQKKNLWQQVIKAKIRNQAMVLELNNLRHNDLDTLADKVQSGDVGNLEAVAARIYWERLFGKGFRRNPDLPGINSFLNYGYAILRASMCRCIVASGLIPELGIHHHNQMNPYCLADDLMEPFRPYIDICISIQQISDATPLSTMHKKTLIGLLDLPVKLQDNNTHIRYCILHAVEDFVQSLVQKKASITFPLICAETAICIKGRIN
ncbi:MAG: type II CRISPR-associated endonuclease Cas1 [Candidatus Cloacimonetes bacterium HGW-Cloacimonetes-3]|jgi:CRISPR-associated protein Cas1|nr:MAG: type II CRISPR-associated endonuclease Cas1 [Candidatus Cloacimonetes bacterium HGW-Cloacimonetes-3]